MFNPKSEYQEKVNWFINNKSREQVIELINLFEQDGDYKLAVDFAEALLKKEGKLK